MIKNKKKQEGIGLAELFLVIIVGAAILYYSIQQYASYRRDADVLALQTNVDVIFQGLGRYFQANCNNPNSALYPTSPSFNSSSPYPVTVQSLVSSGYITSPLPNNPLVDYSTAENGYIAQFNLKQTMPNRQIPLSTSAGGGTTSGGTIVVWEAQVGVLLKNKTAAQQYANLLGADCLSIASGSTVTPCTGSSAPTGGTVAVWQRLPSLPSSTMNSGYWPTNPTVKQFTQMYQTDPILMLTNGVFTADQYYVCGS